MQWRSFTPRKVISNFSKRVGFSRKSLFTLVQCASNKNNFSKPTMILRQKTFCTPPFRRVVCKLLHRLGAKRASGRHSNTSGCSEDTKGPISITYLRFRKGMFLKTRVLYLFLSESAIVFSTIRWKMYVCTLVHSFYLHAAIFGGSLNANQTSIYF